MAQNFSPKLAGMHTLKNNLSSVPEGSLVRADNIVINRDNIAESRRGFAVYGDEFGNDADRAKQLLTYKGRILIHYDDVLLFDSDGEGAFVAFTEPVNELETGLRIKGVEGNGNFLFTTNTGIKKISVSTTVDLAADGIRDAGVPQALEIRGTADTGTPGFLTPTSKVAYRVLWGYKDANNNLVIGSPSTRVVVENAAGTSAVVDLEFTIPEGITTQYFYQLYRSAIVPNTNEPDDELNLVLEDNPSSTDITNGFVAVTDITPDDFRAGGVLLYTNPISGEGINQANDPPPLAKDLALFKNSTFYANTKTRHRLFLNLLSIDDFTAGLTELIISDGDDTETYTFDVTEDVLTKKILLSTSPSVSIAIDETARSLIFVINRQTTGKFYAFYLSGPNDVPGQILLQRRDQSDTQFFLATNDSAATNEWSPVLPLTNTITAITTGGTPTVTTTSPHGYATNDYVLQYGTNSTPDVDGKYKITVTGLSTYTIIASPAVTVAGTGGTVFATTAASDNEVAPNRIYFSKNGQQEAVPIVNFLDVGPKDQPIKRILALRDSLFILKTDGVYRLTGDDPTTYSVFLFDGSCRIYAPDSAAVLNNQIYMYSTEGVSSISDTGVEIRSREIENLLIPLTASQFTFNSTASFGVAYQNDRAYIVWLVTTTGDEVATQCLRYNIFTNTWTRWPIGKTCAVVNDNSAGDGKLYLGADDINNIERERKQFDRFDYADRQYITTIPANSVNDNVIDIGSLANLKIGDVLLQEQYVTISEFNRLLQKLDLDAGLFGGFQSAFMMLPGDNLSTHMTLLVAELNVQDSSTVYTFSGTTNPVTIQTEYNVMIGALNTSPQVFYSNYQTSVGLKRYDAIITEIDTINVNITINYPIPFMVGDVILYKSIYMRIEWNPVFMGDASITKHVSEATMLFETSAFFGASVSYGSDLSKNFDEIFFNAMGNGQFGNFPWGEHTWGGEGNQVPIRTYVPQQKQRCRWINTRFDHKNALENVAIYGISYTFEPMSQRGYR